MANKPASAIPHDGREETYDEWFLRRIDRAIAQAGDPATQWVAHDVVMDDWEEQRKEILSTLETKK